jgi:tripartite-type tricarboxylate transporter receptor subunit TctC
MSIKKLAIVSIVLVFTVILFLSGPQAAPYYEGKTITFIICHGAGGGTDTYGRTVARYLGRNTPGNPTIIVRNMLGGGGTIGGNYVANTAKKDGLTVLIGSGPNALNSLLQTVGVEYDYANMPIVGILGTAEVHAASTEIVQRREQLVEKGSKITFGGGPMPDANALFWILAEKILGFEAKKVLAYRGTASSLRGFLAGEVTATYASVIDIATLWSDLIAENKLIPLFQSGLLDVKGQVIKDESTPDIPTVNELHQKIHGVSPSGEFWNMCKAYIGYVRTLSKILIMPPGTEKYASILRDSFNKMWMEDTEFRAALKKIAGDKPAVYSGKDAVAVLEATIDTAGAVKKNMQSWLSTDYGVEFKK